MNRNPERMRARLSLAAVALAATGFLGACMVVPVDRAGYPVASSDEVLLAPPPPQYEVVGLAPAPGLIWIGGYWGWTGGRHLWTPGRWTAPRPGYLWSPHRWQRGARGWRESPGHWRRR